jgi:hypothetical protein
MGVKIMNKGEKMRKWFALTFTILALAGCSIEAVPVTPGATALPVDNLTAEAERERLADATSPAIEGTVVDVNAVLRFDDMAPASAEIMVDGDLAATGTFPTSDQSVIGYETQPDADPTEFPTRRLTFSIDVRSGSEIGLLSVTIYTPEGMAGAHNLVKAATIMPDQFGVIANVANLGSDFLTVTDQDVLAIQGDIRVLENGENFTAAFDFTITNSATNQSVHLIGRVNEIPFSPV